MRSEFFIGLFLSCVCGYSQCQDAGWTSTNSVCIKGNLELVPDFPTGEFYWDFCSYDFEETVEIQEILNDPIGGTRYGFRMVEDNGQWFGFATIWNQNKLLRYDFGSSPQNIPTVVDLGNPGGLLNSPDGLDIIKYEGIWQMVVGYLPNGGNLVRLDFGNDLRNTPTASLLDDFVTGRVRDLRLLNQNDSLILVFPYFNENNIYRINYRNSLSNLIAPENIYISTLPGAFKPRGLAITRTCGSWKLIVLSEDGKIQQFNFGSSLLDEPISDWDSIFSAIERPLRVEVKSDGGNHYACISSDNQDTNLINLGKMESSSIPSLMDNSGYGMLGGLDIVDYEGKKIVLGFEGSKLFQYLYENECQVTPSYSHEAQPVIQYNRSGKKFITLKKSGNSGFPFVHTDTITILPTTAPDIDYSNSTFCITSPSEFQSTSDLPITSYSWDFGDGTGTSADQNPSYQYFTSGTYDVRLTVEADNGCGQFIEREIQIYEEPVTDFSVPPDPLCTNTPIEFTNTSTGETGPIVTWEWDMNGEETLIARDTSYSFATAGVKSIVLKGSIPGCENSITKPITLQAGPLTDFVIDSVCFGNQTFIQNLTAGDGTEMFTWNFGDGTSSTDTNPVKEYDSPGSYAVSLRSENAIGCVSSREYQTLVHSIPVASFENLLSCNGQGTQFNDLSSVSNANITKWEWQFPDDQSDLQNPLYTFMVFGDQEVKLKSFSNFGCVDSVTNIVSVQPSPDARIWFDKACEEDIIQFRDSSNVVGGVPIISRTWLIDNVVYTNESVTQFLSDTGPYPVSLTVEAANFCRNSLDSVLLIDPALDPGFIFDRPCTGEVTFTDTTSELSNSIAERTWLIDETLYSGETATVEFEKAGLSEASLTVITQNGCEYLTSIQSLRIFEQPIANLSTGFPNNDVVGGYPLEVQFTSLSTDADSIVWDFGDNEISNEENPLRSFDETTDVLLTVFNEVGCEDQFRQPVEVLDPFMDISVEDAEIVTDSNGNRFVKILIRNNQTVVVDEMDIRANLDGSEIIHPFVERLFVEPNLLSYTIPTGFPASLQEEHYVCVEIFPQHPIYEDQDPSNNLLCMTLKGESLILAPFPNPVKDQLNVPVILSSAGSVNLEIISFTGNTILSQTYPNRPEGLTQLQIETSTYLKGMYLINVTTDQGTQSHKVFINP